MGETVTKLGYGMPLAGSNLNDSVNDLAAAKKNKENIVISRKDVKNNDLIKVLDEANVPKNSKGVVYKKQTFQSFELFKQTEIRNFIRKNLKELTNGDFKNKIVDIEFKDGLDSYLALQHCKLVNPTITKDGFFKAKIVDYYDFNRREGSGIGIQANNWGYSMQEKGYLENFFVIYYIDEKLNAEYLVE